MRNPRTRWLEARGALVRLLAELRPHLDEETAELISELIEQREFGVALDLLTSVVFKTALSEEQRQKLRDIGEILGRGNRGKVESE